MKNGQQGTHSYDDIIGMPHHVSKTHPQMALSDRAAQFSPFRAIDGYTDAVKETARLTEEFAELDEDFQEELDRKLTVLQEHINEMPEITVMYFQPDRIKAGGVYRSLTGPVRKIDLYGRKLVMADGTMLEMRYIVQMEGELFALTME